MNESRFSVRYSGLSGYARLQAALTSRLMPHGFIALCPRAEDEGRVLGIARAYAPSIVLLRISTTRVTCRTPPPADLRTIDYASAADLVDEILRRLALPS